VILVNVIVLGETDTHSSMMGVVTM